MASLRRALGRGRLPLFASAGVAALVAGCAVQPGDEPLGTTSEATTVCASGTTVKGVDVSTYQGSVDWASVKAAGIDFAFTRISDGTGSPDGTFKTNWEGMKTAGIIRGAYQYWEPADDPTAQANLVASSLQGGGGLVAGDLPVVMDIETSGGASAATIEANMTTWLAAVKASTGKTPIIYTSEGTYPITATTFDTYDLWAANYTTGCPAMPVGWTKWVFWQNADNGSVGGISGGVDTDEYNGTLAELQAYAGGGGTTSPDSGTSGGGTYGAQYVSQSWPLASTAMPMTTCQTTPATITFKNTGTLPWDSSTHLATTQPRDRTSDFADSTWLSVNRLAGVTGTVPPGGTFEFKFDFHAPPTAGSYQEYFGLVEDGVAWFSDPGQGGPADDDIEANVTVTAGTGTCTVDPGVPDGGTSSGGTDGGAASSSGSGSGSGGTSSGGTGSSGASSSGGGGSGSGSGSSSGGLSGGDAGASAGHGGDGGSGANGDASFKSQGTGCAVAQAGGGREGTGGAGGLAALLGVALGFARRRRAH
ncbi:MAG TPA: GH25 family lysozyme [Polyangiaceae bacterium]|jgi:lysozyme